MATFEHLLQSYDVGDALDDIASADPPAYLRRCFAEALSTPSLSFPRVQQLAVCAMVLDAILDARDYEDFEVELIADWRLHYAQACAALRQNAVTALRRGKDTARASAPQATADLDELLRRLENG